MVKILDCTLRDGSHITKFSDECILKTLNTAENSNVDFVELGYTMPNCVKSSSSKLVVMVDTKNLQPVSELADYVRVACYPNQIEQAIYAIEDFYSKGFGVFLHIMTADKFDDFDILKNWKNKNILESLYFADSFGALLPNNIEDIYKKFQNVGFEKISFHAHNNLQLAFANTIKAIEIGTYSVDASVFGIGRGAGNLPIELLLKYLNKDNSKYLKLIEEYYITLSKEYNWGYNYENLICGLKNIHPSKVKAIV